MNASGRRLHTLQSKLLRKENIFNTGGKAITIPLRMSEKTQILNSLACFEQSSTD